MSEGAQIWPAATILLRVRPVIWPVLLVGVMSAGCHAAAVQPRPPGELAGAAPAPSQDNPVGALRLFANALEAGDCQRLLALAPPAVRLRLHDEALLQGCRQQRQQWQALAAVVRSAAAGLRANSERAEALLADGRCLQLRKLGGRWYVADISSSCGGIQGP